MRHLRSISTIPRKAQETGVCEGIESDFQARLCFMIQFLTSFILPWLELKDGGDNGGETEA